MLLGTLLASCSAQPRDHAVTPATATAPTPADTIVPTQSLLAPTPTAAISGAGCDLNPVAVPTMPAVRPGYAQLDATTGLHVTGRPREIDLADYRIEVSGLVAEPLQLSYDDLRCMPRVSDSPLLVCPGFFEDRATWAGASLAHILDLAGVAQEATAIRIVGADRFETRVTLDQIRESGGFLAYEWEGEPLPILHGFPVRAVFPALEGNKWVKWIVKIEVY